MTEWEYKSSIKAKCGVEECPERFDLRSEWVNHCKEKHPEFYKDVLEEKK